MLTALATHPGFNSHCAAWLFQMVFLSTPLVLVQVLQEKRRDSLAPIRLSLVPRSALYALVIIMIVTLGNTGSRAFIYFQF
jgi:hypothetical protein